jgi:LacI family transcriptional regulator
MQVKSFLFVHPEALIVAGMKSGSVSQQRIARDLGVSQALVSLVLNGKRENISEESYKRIWDYAIKIGYRPKGMQLGANAAGLTNVGFVLRSGVRLYTQSNFFSHVQHGLHMALQQQGLNSVFLGAEDHLTEQTLKQKLQRGNLFGVVLLGEMDERIVRTIKKSRKRVVSISASYPGLCHSVIANETQAAELLLSHLTDLGHKQFAWLGGNKGLRMGNARRNSIINALRLRGIEVAEENCIDMPSGDRLDGRKAAAAILDRGSRRNSPTAWVCFNGLMARGAMNLLLQKGYNVPSQVSIVAIDATRVCVEEHPEITGANADPEKMGAKAAELLLKDVGEEDESLTDVVMPAHLSIRETSGNAPG